MNKCMNISLVKCFYCQKDSGIAIDEKLIDCKDKWKNTYVFGGYEPCDECIETFSKGFLVVECQENPIAEGQPEIQENVYPTGNHWVIRNDAAKEIFGEDKFHHGKIFVDREFAVKVGLYKGIDNGEN